MGPAGDEAAGRGGNCGSVAVRSGARLWALSHPVLLSSLCSTATLASPCLQGTPRGQALVSASTCIPTDTGMGWAPRKVSQEFQRLEQASHLEVGKLRPDLGVGAVERAPVLL